MTANSQPRSDDAFVDLHGAGLCWQPLLGHLEGTPAWRRPGRCTSSSIAPASSSAITPVQLIIDDVFQQLSRRCQAIWRTRRRRPTRFRLQPRGWSRFRHLIKVCQKSCVGPADSPMPRRARAPALERNSARPNSFTVASPGIGVGSRHGSTADQGRTRRQDSSSRLRCPARALGTHAKQSPSTGHSAVGLRRAGEISSDAEAAFHRALMHAW